MRPSILCLIVVASSIGRMYARQSDSLIHDTVNENYLIQYTRGDSSKVSVTFEPATKIVPRINCKVTASEKKKLFVYEYEVENAPESKQSLSVFVVSFGHGLQIEDGSSCSWLSRRRMEVKNKTLDYSDMWMWTNKIGIQPSSGLTGFRLLSPQLPGINSAYFQGKVSGMKYPDKGPNLQVKTQILRLRSFPRNYVVKNTISPGTIPDTPRIFFDTLLSYVHQSHELGWINNTRDDDCEADERAEDGIVKNLDKRLTTTKDLIVKDKISAAKSRLQMFLNKVEKLWNRQQKEEAKNRKNPKIIFTSEAYALLKYNGEYLLDHLTEPKGTKGDKKERE